ncbi:MAG: type II toxin-antitoxin system Phd/YefM family antitoxin [Betaproteobacteria bacterium]|nr:type II toxin-antitoxin system Phd/YefM family antitoxin [Betaproteobacteria bacterium]
MEKTVSKSKFKPRALEYFRQVEETRQGLIITDRGKPVLKITPYEPARARKAAPAGRLRGAILRYDSPFEPVGLEDWEALK